MANYIFQPQEGATNPLRLPVYATRAEREKAMEQILIDLSTLRDDAGLHINLAPFVMQISNIYMQAEDAKEQG